LEEIVLDNVFFDTCVYWQPGLELLLKSIPAKNVLYASEMIGAVQGVDAQSGQRFDDTKFLLDSITEVSDADRQLVMGENALRVYGRLASVLESRGILH
jgi:4-oxalmesaconate hydratase